MDRRRRVGAALPQPAHPGIGNPDPLQERRPRATAKQLVQVGVQDHLPGQAGPAPRTAVEVAFETKQPRPVDAFLAVAEVAEEFRVRKHFHCRAYRAAAKARVAGKVDPVAERERAAEQHGIVPMGAPACVDHRIPALRRTKEDAARTGRAELKTHLPRAGHRQVAGDTGEHAQPGIQVQHQFQVALLATWIRAPNLAQEHAAQLLAILARIGQAQNRERIRVARPPADQIQRGIEKQPFAVAHAERGMKHQLIPRPHEVRQVEHRHAADAQGRGLHCPLARGEQPHPPRAHLVIWQLRIGARGKAHVVEDDGAIRQPGDGAGGEREGKRSGGTAAPLPGGRVDEHRLGAVQIERHGGRVHRLRRFIFLRDLVRYLPARGQQPRRAIVNHFVGANHVHGVRIGLAYHHLDGAAQGHRVGSGLRRGGILGVCGLPDPHHLGRLSGWSGRSGQSVKPAQPRRQLRARAAVIEAEHAQFVEQLEVAGARDPLGQRGAHQFLPGRRQQTRAAGTRVRLRAEPARQDREQHRA